MNGIFSHAITSYLPIHLNLLNLRTLEESVQGILPGEKIKMGSLHFIPCFIHLKGGRRENIF